MSINLKRVQVQGLFNTYKLNVPIKDNTLILVGENGSGKSTLINLIYYALTAQWDRLSELPFQVCTITIDDKKYRLDKEQLPSTQKRSSALGYLKRNLSKSVLDSLLNILSENTPEYWSTSQGREELRNLTKPILGSIHRVAFSAIAEVAQTGSMFNRRNRVDGEHVDGEQYLGPKELAELIGSNEDEQVLFLPTYRRIEKELSDVFPDLNLEETSSSYLRNRKIRKQASYIELVEFGMTDVAEAFKSSLTTLDQEFRSELNRFTGSYLHNILQGLYKDVDASSLATNEVAETVDLMLSRIGEEILSEDDRRELRNLLENAKSNQTLNVEQRISAHFLTNLVVLHKNQQEREIPVRKLVELINQYLSNKKLEFNPTAFELIINRNDIKNSRKVPLYGLSSGEKQIVSLFSHVFLGSYQKYFVVIDEPELSISVPWQRRFLQDLKETGKCSGLIAVTHSPFVFDNSLAEYAHSISEFVREN
ncbi:AAA family ATPase [Leptolyngbya sp. FACHB-321]|uniref:AAA family ATPase n=1 Tax=Leptolyngbya sp. FACHB-321 TaxID=2692807 RepID=UPI00168A3BD3|nr:AAA family ATPase [Leptolyngbya sp. FACHB-321]MBD2033632.1 AAA family ATPase [Leptolyngbya sp. FACHB-321]